jgi:hypothetical protein
MSVFSPAARTTDPDGRDWEIYAYRIQLRKREPPTSALRRIPWVVRRALVDLPLAALAARHSDEWTIEAVTEVPHKTIYTWKTTGEYRGHVVAQVEAGLAYGEIPRPRHATFIGVEG